MFSKYFDEVKVYYRAIVKSVPGIVFLYFGIVLAHFVASNMYPSMCCGSGLWGFIMTPFMVVTPHCEAMRWVIHYTGDQIRNIWLWLGGYLVVYFGKTVTPLFLKYTPLITNKNMETNTDDLLNCEDYEDSDGDTLKRRKRN